MTLFMRSSVQIRPEVLRLHAASILPVVHPAVHPSIRPSANRPGHLVRPSTCPTSQRAHEPAGQRACESVSEGASHRASEQGMERTTKPPSNQQARQ